MPITTNAGLRYPDLTQAPNVPLDIGNLASDTDAKLHVTAASISARDALVKWTGLRVYVTADKRTYLWDGSAWQYASGPLIWTTLTINGFNAVGGDNPRYAMDASGLVHLAGQMSNIQSYSQPSAVFATLPAGYRPPYYKRVPIATSSATAGYNATLRINTDGTLVIDHFSGTSLAGEGWHLDGVNFSTT